MTKIKGGSNKLDGASSNMSNSIFWCEKLLLLPFEIFSEKKRRLQFVKGCFSAILGDRTNSTVINEEYRARAFKIEICRAIKQSVLYVSPSFCHHFSTKLENSTMLEKKFDIILFCMSSIFERSESVLWFFLGHTHITILLIMITDQQSRKDAKDVLEMCNEVLISDLRRE